MKLLDVTWQHRFDLEGILKCEHCDHEQLLKAGYDDYNYHHNVIPNIKCKKCDKSTKSELKDVTHAK